MEWQFSGHELVWYLSGAALMGIFGALLLRQMSIQIPNISMHEYYGYASSHPRTSLFFFLACLGLMGFPISPTFVGEDLLFSHIHEQQVLLAFIFSLGYIVSGIALIRLYARLFLGHETRPHFSHSLMNQ